MALSIDAISHAVAENSNSTLASVGKSWTHTCGASANKLVITVGIGSNLAGANGRNIATVTYNGVPCTQLVEADDGNFEHVEIWELNNPPTGSAYSIVVNTIADAAAAQLAAGATSFIDADATNRDTSAANGNSAGGSVQVDSAAGDYCVGMYATDGSGVNTVESNTLLWEDEGVGGDDSDFNAQYAVASGASTTLSWTSDPDPWAACAVAIRQSVGGGPQLFPQSSF